VQEAFKTSFKGLGGDIVGEDRIPLRTVDFAPFAERIVQAKPDVLMMFVGTGAPAVGFLKALVAQGAVGKNITIIGRTERDDPDLPNFHVSTAGVYSTIAYARGPPYEENRKFKEGVKAKFGSVIPNFVMAESYDSMSLLFHRIASQQGKPFDGASAIAA